MTVEGGSAPVRLTGSRPAVPRSAVQRGDHGVVVAEVRARLLRLGLVPGADVASPAAGSAGSADPGTTTGPLPVIDDVFDEPLDRAVRTFQQRRGLTVDGVVGPQTFRRLEEARWCLGDRVLAFAPGHLVSGDDVLELQRRLIRMGFDCGRADGVFGVLTDAALREFQRNVGVEADGTCGPATFKALNRLVRTVGGGQADLLREQLSLAALRSGVADKVVVLDPGHGGDDPGTAGPPGMGEADVADDIAARVEGRLAALGTTVLVTRPRSQEVVGFLDESARAQFANETGADLVVSLHTDWSSATEANGVATYYYGDPSTGVHSLAGREAAERLQHELTARTDLNDCRSHPRAWDLLRLTRMPAVRVELGYLSHPGDAARLADAHFRDVVAEGLAAAVVGFFEPE